jgi:hypothetical protein
MPKLILDGDAKGAVKAHGELTESQKRTKEGIDQIGKAAWETHRKMTEWAREQKKEQAAAAAEQKKMGEEAHKIILANEGPQERHNRRVQELGRLYVAGKLSLEQMDSALKRYNADMAHTAIIQQEAFGTKAIEAATGYFSALVGPGALITAATTALSNYRQQLTEIGNTLQAERSGMGQLMQLAALDRNPEAKRRALVGEAKQIYSSGATTSLGQAGNLLFQLESANITDPRQRKMIVDMLGSGVLPDAGQFSASIAAMRSAFPEMSPGQMIGMGITAGAISPGDASQIVAATGKSAQQLKALGFSPAFGMAAESILSRDYGGPSEGQVRLEQMLKHLEHDGFASDPSLRGKDPFTILRKIGAGGIGEGNLGKYAGGRMEAMSGLRSLIGNIDLLEQLTQQAGGSDEGLARRALSLAQATPEIDTARQAVASRNMRTLSRMPAATIEQLYQSMIDEQVAGSSAWREPILRAGAYIFGQTDAAKQVKLRESVGDPFYSRELQESVVRLLQSIDSKTTQQRVAPAASGRQEK